MVRTTEARDRRRLEQKVAMESALVRWLKSESAENGRALYLAGCAYFGMKPDKHERHTDCDVNEL